MTPTVLGPAWVLPAALSLIAVASLMAVLDGVLAPRRTTIGSGAAAPAREAARLLLQRRRRTPSADRLLWRIATFSLLPLAMLMVLFVPLGSHTLVETSIGVVWFNALDVVVWALVWLAGWGANAAYGLIGGYRFLAMALAYELPLMFALVAPAIAAGSLDVAVIAGSQSVWNVVWMPVAFAAYCLGVLGFSVWGPMDVAAGRDLAGGVLAELSGVDRLLFLGGRYCLLVAGAAFAVPLFLGGGSGPVLPDVVWVVLKTVVLAGLLVATRRRLPALRPDLLMEVAWVVLLPLVILQDLVVAVVSVAIA